jgi:peptidyl-prolyl cis-trans isomerase B (cyclophilin B)
VASSRDRQRKLARAKLDRQMARRAAALRRRRRIQAGVGATAALALIVLGSVWALGGFDSEPETPEAEVCTWTPQDGSANTNLKDVGMPDTTGPPTSGTRPMTITTNQGDPITVELDLTNSPCAGASFAHLAANNFYDNTTCHEITDEGAVRCGDPSGTGEGGATYAFPNEELPAPATTPETPGSPEPTPGATAGPDAEPTPAGPPAYPAGTVALIGSPPGNNSSQFLIFFEDFNPADPTYSIVGRVTSGLDVVKKIGALEKMDNGSGALTKPATDVVIQSLTVGEVDADGASPQPAPSEPASAAPTPSGQS